MSCGTLASAIAGALRPDRKVAVTLRGRRSRPARVAAVLADGLELIGPGGGERGFVPFTALDFIRVPTADPSSDEPSK